MTAVELKRDLVIVTCAISAGIHGALSPEHFAESTPAGLGFVAATVLLAALAVVLTLYPASTLMHAGAAAVLAGLLVGYALAVTTGLPLLHPNPEPVDGVGLATKAIELVALLAATSLTFPETKGTTTWTRRGLHARFPSS